MYEYKLKSAKFLLLNTYKEALTTSFFSFILFGKEISDWEGANRNYKLGWKYFLSSKKEVRKKTYWKI